jgi:hypothetical protein
MLRTHVTPWQGPALQTGPFPVVLCFRSLSGKKIAMTYTSWDLGNQDIGAVVQVVLEGNAANVKLMDASNFRSYQRRDRHEYFGGFYERSPVVIPVPRYGHWHLAIDYAGRAGRGRATVRVLSPQGV